MEYLTDEGLRMGKRFTGAALGLAAVGKGEAVFTDYTEEMTDAFPNALTDEKAAL